MACHCYIAKQAHDCEAACSILLNIFKPLTEILTHLPAFSAAPMLVMQILPTIQEENDGVMSWEMIVQSTFWANYLLPNSPYCMNYISGERLKEKIEVDHSWEWKG